MKTKIILLALVGLLAAACTQKAFVGQEEWDGMLETEKETSVSASPDRPHRRPLKAALLLPLSGDRAELGEALQNAGLMALNDDRAAPLSLWFYDTKGSTAGAKEAYENALAQRAHIIIGPVFSSEAQAVRQERPDVPLISLSSDSAIMGHDMHTFGLLISDQMTHIARFACQNGQRKLAVLGPENKVAEQAMNTLAEEINRCPGMTLEKVSLYDAKTTNLAPPILKIVPKPKTTTSKRGADTNTPLTEEEDIPLTEKIGVDAFIILEEGTKLRQVMSLLSFYDVTPNDIPIYGLTSWSQVKDKTLAGAYIPTLDEEAFKRFQNRYQAYFNAIPPRLSSQLYDAVRFVAKLSYQAPITNETLLTPMGFNGIDGRVRLKENGLNERLLIMRQIDKGLRLKTVQPALETFPDPEAPFVEPLFQPAADNIPYGAISNSVN